ncbi:GNAT family N-acetyltransferase [Xenorhabdus entomophaga]|uniref:GNAT family N-acetyltransferase n=1 Tax=Xenorhabdus entomophaga TaxID=3136257 RepID=UPI0030F3762B
MFRSKSFNINRPTILGSLIHAKSVLGISSVMDARMSIKINEVSASEALNVTNIIMTETMDCEWKCDDSEHWLDNQQEKWNKRYDSAFSIFELAHNKISRFIKEKKASKINSLFFAAYFKGVPIGILSLSFASEATFDMPEVDYLATHCGIRGCGVLLIEQAVNKSQQLGKNGNLKLNPLSEAVPAYMEMGFVETGSHMELHPIERNDKWKYDGTTKTYRYRFK